MISRHDTLSAKGLCKQYSRRMVVNDVDVKVMIGILKLAIKQGEIFQLTIDGEDEETFMKQFEELVNKDV